MVQGRGAARPHPRPQRQRARRQPRRRSRRRAVDDASELRRRLGERRRTRPRCSTRLADRDLPPAGLGAPSHPHAEASRQRLSDSSASATSSRCRSPTDVSEDLEILLTEHADEFPAVAAERITVRSYPYGQLAAHVLGYVGADQRRASSTRPERAKPYEPRRPDRQGRHRARPSRRSCGARPARCVYEVDARGNPMRELDRAAEPVPGNDVYLTIDINVQTWPRRRWPRSSSRALGGRCDDDGTRRRPPPGAVVVLDPAQRAGPGHGVVPDLRPVGASSTASRTTSTTRSTTPTSHPPLIDRAIRAQYAPGSTFKLVTAYAGARAYGHDHPRQPPINDPGTYERAGLRRAGDDCRNATSPGAHGTVDLPSSLTVSSDVYFYTLGDEHLARQRPARRRRHPGRSRRPRASATTTGSTCPASAAAGCPTPDWHAVLASAARGQPRQAFPDGTGSPVTTSTSRSVRATSSSRRCSSPTPTPRSPTAARVYTPDARAPGAAVRQTRHGARHRARREPHGRHRRPRCATRSSPASTGSPQRRRRHRASTRSRASRSDWSGRRQDRHRPGRTGRRPTPSLFVGFGAGRPPRATPSPSCSSESGFGGAAAAPLPAHLRAVRADRRQPQLAEPLTRRRGACDVAPSREDASSATSGGTD